MPRPFIATISYRPGCGSEGGWFQNHWCCRCERDARYTDGDPEKGCPILAATFAFAEDSPNYPAEWVQDAEPVGDHVFPRCTAFYPTKEDPGH